MSEMDRIELVAFVQGIEYSEAEWRVKTAQVLLEKNPDLSDDQLARRVDAEAERHEDKHWAKRAQVSDADPETIEWERRRAARKRAG